MANDYSAIGFRLETDDELRCIYEENKTRLHRTVTPDGTAEVLAAGGGPELWFYGFPGESVDPTLCEPFLRVGEPLTARVAGVYGCEGSPCPVLELRFRGDAFALHMLHLNHLDGAIRPGDECRVQLCLIAQSLKTYRNRRDFFAGQPGRLDCPAVVPWLDLTRSDLREPLAHCVGSGGDWEAVANPLTKRGFHLLKLNCFGVSLTAAADASLRLDALSEPRSVADGVFWVCGTAVKA